MRVPHLGLAKLVNCNQILGHVADQNYRSGTVNSKSFVSKVLLRIKQKFELN